LGQLIITSKLPVYLSFSFGPPEQSFGLLYTLHSSSRPTTNDLLPKVDFGLLCRAWWYCILIWDSGGSLTGGNVGQEPIIDYLHTVIG